MQHPSYVSPAELDLSAPCWHPACLLTGVSTQLANGVGQIPPRCSLIEVNEIIPWRNLAQCPVMESTTNPAGKPLASLMAGRIFGTENGFGSRILPAQGGDRLSNTALNRPGSQ